MTRPGRPVYCYQKPTVAVTPTPVATPVEPGTQDPDKKPEKKWTIRDAFHSAGAVFHPAPGSAGSNAFRDYLDPIEDPTVSDKIIFNFSADYSQSHGRDDTYTGAFSVEIPFPIWNRDEAWTSLRISSHLERWYVSPETLSEQGLEHKSGTTLGDVNLSAKFRIYDETDSRPAISLKVGIKSASGDDLDRRNTNTAGYAFWALGAKDVYESEGFLKKIRVIANLGFAAWDDSANTQDDAFLFGAGVHCALPNDYYTSLALGGSMGWRADDKVLSMGMEVGKALDNGMVCYLSADTGLTSDSNDFRFLAGIRFFLDRPNYR